MESTIDPKKLKYLCLYGQPAFMMHAANNQWSTRVDRGYSSKRTPIFDFLKEVYADWLPKGMTLDDFRLVDVAGHKQFLEHLIGCRRTVPAELRTFTQGRTFFSRPYYGKNGGSGRWAVGPDLSL